MPGLLPILLVSSYVVLAADKMPEQFYSFRTTDKVRTYAEILTHIADTQMLLCGIAKGEQKTGNAASKTSKADVTAALKASFDYCDVVYDSMNDAELLRGAEVRIPPGERVALDPGEYFQSDLIGCEVWEAGAASALGSVRDVEFPGSAPLLAVDTNEGEVLVPLAAEFCNRIDVKAKRIDVTLPEGLRDLNRR